MDPNITIQKVYGSNILGYPVMVMTALHVCVCVWSQQTVTIKMA